MKAKKDILRCKKSAAVHR